MYDAVQTSWYNSATHTPYPSPIAMLIFNGLQHEGYSIDGLNISTLSEARGGGGVYKTQ